MHPESAMEEKSVSRHVSAVRYYVEHTAARYEPLMQPGIVTHPICCFGYPVNAEIVTVGVNPSWGEFTESRWPRQMKELDVLKRCMAYFDNKASPKISSMV